MVKKIFQLIIFILAGYFIIRVLQNNWSEVEATIVNINIWYIIISIVVMSISFVWLAYCWYWVLKKYKINLPFSRAYLLYMKAAIVRYIPGNIWGLAAKTYMMTTIGLKKSESVFVMVFESAILLFSGILTYFITIAYLADSWAINFGLGIIAVFLLLFLMVPSRFIGWIRLLKKDIVIRTLPPIFIARLAFMYIFYWLVTGISMYFILAALGLTDMDSFITAVGIFAVSWSIGFISLITPSGLGVREVAMVYFLGKTINVSMAAAVSVLSRIIFIAGELLSFMAAIIIYHFKKRDG
ncbi:flippase-like domain-containing protein [Patescibacteria group bacterium]|nr:flippase-like domain-containing protein [Patescibacteria group bacterium]MBU0964295.1 flippase-like domain-containing protein [Patescibacteria group bacterium]